MPGAIFLSPLHGLVVQGLCLDLISKELKEKSSFAKHDRQVQTILAIKNDLDHCLSHPEEFP